MKRYLLAGLSGGFFGALMLLVVMSAVGLVGAQSRSSVSSPAGINAVSSVNTVASTNVSTTFTYQGQLKNNGNAVTGACNMAFRLYNDPAAGNQIGNPITLTSVPITNGLFTVGLNFGSNVFTGTALWLGSMVDCNSGYSTLSPRQALTAAPYALHAVDAWSIDGNSGTNSNTNFLGTTDNTSLTIRVNNTVAFRLMPAANPLFTPNVIGGYVGNKIAANVSAATIGGGGGSSYVNQVSGDYGTVGGGVDNTSSGIASIIGGGGSNIASGDGAFVGGGGFNGSAVAGNQSLGNASTIGGGLNNHATMTYTVVGGGDNNTASGVSAFIGGGGYDPTANAHTGNVANGDDATIGGGVGNTASGYVSVVAGGGGYYNGTQLLPNSATARGATVGGGQGNTASGTVSTIPGGNQDLAQGIASFAAGTFARAVADGSFVWSDQTYSYISSTVPNQFLVRASGGITLYTNSGATVGASLYPGSGSWNILSNKDLKANFANVDARDVLARVANLPITTWNYTTQAANIRHIGPMAQDFAAAFQVGENNTTISTIDAQGVALAAIQGLYQENQDLKARVSQLEQTQSPASFSVFNLISVLALIGFAMLWWQQRKQRRSVS